MLAVIDLVSRLVMDKGIGPAAAVLFLFDEENGISVRGKVDGRSETRNATPDDDNVGSTTS